MVDEVSELQRIRDSLDTALASADALGEAMLGAKIADALDCAREVASRSRS
jgi:hypothetical protein